jgi:5,10-methylenetetrahydromethanopterin reductase
MAATGPGAPRRRIGVELYPWAPAPTLLEEVRLAEALGFDAIWLGDSQLIWRELYVLLGAAATVTRRAWLGVGVTNPVTRHPAVTASALVTLQELAGGRAILGLGLGYSAVKTLGLAPARRAALAASVHLIRALCRGETVETPTGAVRLTFGAPERTPPIVIGATGPRMLALAGEVGDGVIITGQVGRPATLAAQLGHVRAGRHAAGRVTAPFLTCVAVPAAVHADAARALAAVRPHVATGLRSPSAVLSPAAQAARAALARVYAVYAHLQPDAAHADVVPPEVVHEFALAGTPAECCAQAEALFAAGVDEITLRPYAVAGETRAAAMMALARALLA